STYHSVRCPDTSPSREGRVHLEAGLKQRLKCDFEVVDHVAAVRPIAPKRRVLMGEHPGRAGLWYFNGLGSRGVLTAPYDAMRLVAAITRGEGIEKGSDIRENL